MGRRIKTVSLHSGDAQNSTWADKAAAYVPADVVAAWVAVTALITQVTGPSQPVVLWVLFVVFLGATPYYIYRQTNEKNKPPAIPQIVITTIAFAIWVVGIGGPFQTMLNIQPVIGQIVLVVWTLLIAPMLPVKQV